MAMNMDQRAVTQQFRFYWNGKQLDPFKTIKEQNIRNNDFIRMEGNLRGGSAEDVMNNTVKEGDDVHENQKEPYSQKYKP